MRWLFSLALLCCCLSVQAQRPPYADQLLLKDGQTLIGQIQHQTEERVDIRLASKNRIKSITRGEIRQIRLKEQIYLELAREARSAGRLQRALLLFNKVRNNHRASGPQDWRKIATAEITRTLRAIAARDYEDILIMRDGRQLKGLILAQDDQTLRFRLRRGRGNIELTLQRLSIKRILNKEQIALAQGDAARKTGRLDDAIGHYERVFKKSADTTPWHDRAGSRLAQILAKMAEDAQKRGDLAQAQQLLRRASGYAPGDPAVRQLLDTVAGKLKAIQLERRGRASKLVSAGKALLTQKAFQAAYQKFVAALNLDPDQAGLRDLIDQCLSNIQVLSYGDFDDPETLDPITSRKRVEHRLGQFLYNSLIQRDEREQFIPDLARRIQTSPSGLTFTFWLRPGVKWSSGEELTARDVEFTVGLLLNKKTANHNPTFAQFISGVEVINPYQLKIKLKRPFYRPLSLLSFKIVPRSPFKTTYLARDNPFCRQPIGSGPFRYKSGLGSRVLELVKNPHFRKPGRPFLTGVQLKRYQDRQSARNDLERGELALLTELRPLDVDFFDKQKNRFSVRQYRARTIYFLAFNHRKPILRHRDLRRAVAHVIDRQRILEQFFNAGNPLKRRGGQAHVVITGPFPYNAWAYNDRVSEYKYEKDYAAQLLREVLEPLGYKRSGNAGTYGGRRYWTKNGKQLVLKLKYPKGDRNVEKACIFIADGLKKIGIRVRLAQKAPRDLFDEVYNKHDFDLVYSKYTFDDTYDVFPLLDPRRRGTGGTNFSGYVNAGLVKLFDAMQKTRSPQRIMALSHEVHRQVHEESVFAFLWQLDQYAAHTNQLRNVRIHPYHLFNDVDGWKILRKR